MLFFVYIFFFHYTHKLFQLETFTTSLNGHNNKRLLSLSKRSIIYGFPHEKQILFIDMLECVNNVGRPARFICEGNLSEQ